LVVGSPQNLQETPGNFSHSSIVFPAIATTMM